MEPVSTLTDQKSGTGPLPPSPGADTGSVQPLSARPSEGPHPASGLQTAAPSHRRRLLSTAIDCPRCAGSGTVPHPRWGARNCPDPEITCPRCHGKGEVLLYTAEGTYTCCGGVPPEHMTDWCPLWKQVSDRHGPRYVTDYGDIRDHPVPCIQCTRPTSALDAICDRCMLAAIEKAA